MKTSKKSDVGAVKVLTQSNGVNDQENNGLNVKIVDFYLPIKTKELVIRIGLFGLKNG